MHGPGVSVILHMTVIDGDVRVRINNQVKVQAEQVVAVRASAPPEQQATPFLKTTGDEGPPKKTFLPALGRQRNDGNRANGDILYRAKSGHNVSAQRGHQATFCFHFQHPLSPSTDQRGTSASPCFRRT